MMRQGLALLPSVVRSLLLVSLALGASLANQSAATSSVSDDPHPPRYRLTDLGTVGTDYFIGNDINEKGQIAGEFTSRIPGIWTPSRPNGTTGALQTFGTVGRNFAYFSALNDAGTAAGEAYNSSKGGGGGNVAFRRGADNTMTPIGEDRSFATDINTAGRISGVNHNVEDTHATGTWNGAVFTPFATPNSSTPEAFSLNDQGNAVGQARYLNQIGSATEIHAVRWIQGTGTDIQPLLPPSTGQSSAYGINNLDHVIGQTLDASVRGFLLADDTFTDLGDLAGGPCVPEDINDSDQIVGAAGDRAFLIEGGDPIDLNTLISPGPYTLNKATCLNNAGQIVCIAFSTEVGNNRGVLLTPLSTLFADLLVTLTAPATINVGQNLTYSGTVKNRGPESSTGTKAEFTLPDGVDLVSTNPASTRAGNVLTFDLGTLADEQVVNVEIVVTPTQAGTLNASLAATAFEGDATTPNVANRSVTAIVPEADVLTSLTATPTTALVGQEVTYEGGVKNNGPQLATEPKAVFTLPAGVELISVSKEFTREGDDLALDFGNLKKGQTLFVQVKIRTTAPGVLTARMRASANENDPTPGNNSIPRDITVKAPAADVSVTGTNTPNPIDIGQVLTYKITVKNNGPEAASGVRMVVPVEGSTSFQTVQTTKGTASKEGPNVVAEIGALAKNETALITITLLAQTAGEVANGAIVTSAESDPNLSNNAFTLTTTIRNPARPNLIGAWELLQARKKGKGKRLKYVINATARISNIGNALAGASKVRFFLSTDRTKDAGDVPLTVKVNGVETPVELPIGALNNNVSQGVPVTGIKVSKKDFNAKLKGKYLLGVVDFAGTVDESNEADNVFPKKGDKANPF